MGKDIIKFYENDDWEVLTNTGWQNFKGVAEYDKKQLLTITLSDNTTINVSANHGFIDEMGCVILAKNSLNSKIKTRNGIANVVSISDKCIDHVYDLVGVENGNTYYTNNILSHNTHLVDQFWKSVFPVISSSKKSKIFIASTANGTDNLFYKLWNGAIEHKNGWGYDKILWDEIPGRDASWKHKTIQLMGSEESFAQEFGCQFMSSGELAINEELFESLKVNCVKPKIVMDENNYKVWREPDDNGVYVVGVDIAEGVNQNASVVQILDLKDLNNIEQVAIYWSNTINPYNFTTKLHEILLQWGSPPACIERNGCGAQVVDQLYNNLRYNNIVSFEVGLGKIKQNRVGIISHTNTKYRCVMNMRYFVNECNSVNIRDIDTLIEIKNFIKYPSGKWAAKPGMDMLDDRVMSLGWALIILDNDICKRYFDILRYDGNNRPVEIRRYDHDYGIKVNKKMFGWSAEADDDVDTIIFTENNTSTTPVINDMKAQGWTMIGDYQTHRSYTPPPDSSYSLF